MTALVDAVVDASPRGVDVKFRRGDTFHLPMTFIQAPRKAFDAITNGTTAVHSDTADSGRGFQVGDVGMAITGDGIPIGTTIAAVIDHQNITLSNPAEGIRSNGRLKWGAAMDVSHWTFTAQVRTNPDTMAVLATFTWDTSQAVNGVVIGTLSAAATAALPSRPARLAWDLQTVVSSEPRTIMAGAVLVGLDVTR